MAKFQMKELILITAQTARLGAGSGAANNVTDKEVGKPVKLVGDSRYDLCAAGDPIDRFIVSMEAATLDGFSIGSVMGNVGDRKEVTFDGLEATPGTGTIAVGDYVVCGTAVAKDTALSGAPKVCKATNQPGVAVTTADATKPNIDIALAAVADAQANARAAWKVVSLGSAGTGAVGTVGVIERM